MAETNVLDASAILAFLFEEQGRDAVLPYLADGTCSAVTLAEVATKLIERGMTPDDAAEVISEMALAVHPLTVADAVPIGAMRLHTRDAGLSLGDRCCLALAQRLGLPVVTADRAWQQVAGVLGVEMRMIR